jgi:nucleotide-binding universal stress UspA family protein
MFKKILVALDSSSLREEVFNKALDLAKATHASLMLCHILSAYEEGSPGIPIRSYQAYYPVLEDSTWQLYQQRWEEFEAEGIAQLRKELDIAQAAGVEAEFTQAAGEPAALICNLANTWHADLILVGSHGRKGLGELLLGSVSNYVVHHSQCSVLVVHGGDRKTTAPVTAAASAKA